MHATADTMVVINNKGAGRRVMRSVRLLLLIYVAKEKSYGTD
jgi:hypothetical protein